SAFARDHPACRKLGWMSDSDPGDIQSLVQTLGSEPRMATEAEAALICQYLAMRVLPARPTSYLLRKYRTHVEDNQEWPSDTTPEEYLASLRSGALDACSG